MSKTKLLLGDNIESLRKLPDNSIDSIVTDPPYGLSFMNKKWDYDVPSVEFWKEVYRVLKPGGHILSFGGTRTYHRMVVNIEDAGFEIRDQIMWLYGSGFPKSHNIGKAVDKRGGESIGWFGKWLVKWRKENNIPQSKIAELFPSKTGGLTGCVSNWELGNNLPTNEQFNSICETFNLPFKSLEEAEREFIGTKTSGIGKAFGDGKWNTGEYGVADEVDITKGQSEYEGWGTALKPANEPICLARKPLSEKSVAENVLKWRTGGINVDGCRIGINGIDDRSAGKRTCNIFDEVKVSGGIDSPEYIPSPEGRFPANIILDEIAAEYLDEQSGITSVTGKRSEKSIANCIELKKKIKGNSQCDVGGNITKLTEYANDKGGASRFFYQAKVSKKERNMGLDLVESQDKVKFVKGGLKCEECNKWKNSGNPCICDEPNFIEQPFNGTPNKNSHPTVKPVSLMAYLCRLITPPGGIVLDPFMGSGSTGIAALLEGFKFCGMENDKDYFKIAESRIANYEKYKEFVK